MLLGLDLGTTNVKALVVDREGRVRARGSAPVALRHVGDGGVEQDIEEIWQATLTAIRQAGQSADLSQVAAVGVSSQGGALQIRSNDDQPIGPVISWLDARGQPFDEELDRDLGGDWLAAHVGHGASAVAVGQIVRLQREHPGRLAWPNRIGFVGDTIVQRLCGRAAHDGSSLSIATLYNPSLRQADPELLDRLGVRAEQLPDLASALSPAGSLLPDAAAMTGLRPGVPVSVAVHDQYAATLGCGVIDPGDVMFGAGTAWVLLAIADRLLKLVIPSAWVCDHVLPQRWGQMFSLAIGGSVFEWALQMTNLAGSSVEAVDALLDSVSPGCDGMTLWPFLIATGGYQRPQSGRLTSLKLAHGRAHLLRATIEGLCLELARQLGWLATSGCPAGKLIMCGGATRSRCTPQMVADVTGCPVRCPDEPEISAFGAAALASSFVGGIQAMQTLVRRTLSRCREFHPGPASASYAAMLHEFTAEVARAGFVTG